MGGAKGSGNGRRPTSSSMDDLPTGQPALALTQKVFERVTVVGLPSDLLPEGPSTSVTVSAACRTPENALRSSVLEFMDTVRRVELRDRGGSP